MRVNPPTLQRPPWSGGDAAGAGGESHQSEEEEEETTRQVDRETDMQETDRQTDFIMDCLMCSCLSSDSGGGNRLSESSCSDSIFVVQDGSCSDGGSGTPLSDRTSLIGLDIQNQNTPEQVQDQGSQGLAVGSDKAVKDGEDLESSFSQPG